ncbi:MAG: xanthine dehydrogenase family protein subunit M [Burkholderiales bacterium]|nr:xanthine dehydrogenase family protein subunit M [Burkholderiales bacterium]
MSLFVQPTGLDDAIAHLATTRATVLAGGTDLYPACVGKPPPDSILDISRVGALRGIRAEIGIDGAPTHTRIGAATTWSEIIAHPLPGAFAGLKAAAREIGGRQIQNAGTIAGNLCNASPAADGVPPLLALGATVELASSRGVRQVALADFIRGNRRTVLEPDELLTAVLVPAWTATTRSAFLKLGHRRYLVISVTMVAVNMDIDAQGLVRRCAVAVGACSAVAQRLPQLEARLVGTPASLAPRHVEPRDLKVLSPIDDVRGSAAYRLEAAQELVRRALNEVGKP